MLIALNKPFNVLCQFTDRGHGSEHRRTEKTYLVQVEGELTQPQSQQLRQSILLNDGPTLRASATLLPAQPDWLWPRDPPVRFRKRVADAWIELAIREGRNRQVRRMTAAVGLPTLRLIRLRIGDIALGDLVPGETRAEEKST